jgi:NAD(P)-dependent dehydrogenase (short-subunit alcohol dehydrogenase family)
MTARGLLQDGARVFIACRNADLGEQAAKALREQTRGQVDTLPLNLGDLESVRSCARRFTELGLPLHALINNAGVAGSRGFTSSGFELAFGINHVGHFLLTMLLVPQLRAAGRARIVHVASKAHYQARGIDWDAVRKRTPTITALKEYGVSKLANVLFSAELARRLQGTGITSYALHPGVVASDVWRSVPQPFRWLMTRAMISPERGAATSLYCAAAPELADESGLYYDSSQSTLASSVARDPALAAELWQRSVGWTGADLDTRTAASASVT